uniref:hypothetical protein n=1 Tax=uncultured Caulobacter sp. TaxID=158749 RepID=UPI0025EE8F32|nr:hypothetical protein [uncultured Caulobacter sp.]
MTSKLWNNLLSLITAEAPYLSSKTFNHAQRQFEIRVEISDTDPSYVEAVVYEDGQLASLPYPGDDDALPTFGVTLSRNAGCAR